MEKTSLFLLLLVSLQSATCIRLLNGGSGSNDSADISDKTREYIYAQALLLVNEAGNMWNNVRQVVIFKTKTDDLRSCENFRKENPPNDSEPLKEHRPLEEHRPLNDFDTCTSTNLQEDRTVAVMTFTSHSISKKLHIDTLKAGVFPTWTKTVKGKWVPSNLCTIILPTNSDLPQVKLTGPGYEKDKSMFIPSVDIRHEQISTWIYKQAVELVDSERKWTSADAVREIVFIKPLESEKEDEKALDWFECVYITELDVKNEEEQNKIREYLKIDPPTGLTPVVPEKLLKFPRREIPSARQDQIGVPYRLCTYGLQKMQKKQTVAVMTYSSFSFAHGSSKKLHIDTEPALFPLWTKNKEDKWIPNQVQNKQKLDYLELDPLLPLQPNE